MACTVLGHCTHVGKPLVSVVGCSGHRIPVFPRVAIDQSCALIQGSRRHSNLELVAKHSSISHLQEGRVASDEILGHRSSWLLRCGHFLTLSHQLPHPESKASLHSVLGKARASAARKHVNIGVTSFCFRSQEARVIGIYSALGHLKRTVRT